jgi:hypothetical protein
MRRIKRTPIAPAALFGVPQMTMPIPLQSGPRRGNTVATSILSSVSTASRKPPDLQALDSTEPIYTGRFRLSALWTVWSVEVRVFSGA